MDEQEYIKKVREIEDKLNEMGMSIGRVSTMKNNANKKYMMKTLIEFSNTIVKENGGEQNEDDIGENDTD